MLDNAKVCGKAISRKDSEDFEDMCWECWDDQLTEESGLCPNNVCCISEVFAF
jgi:hypothetical protein